MGRVEARPLEGADPQFDDVNDMVVLVYAFADSRAAFESVINAELDQEHIAVIRVEAAGPLHALEACTVPRTHVRPLGATEQAPEVSIQRQLRP